MYLAEIFGYIAAGLVLATFSMRTMLPLRVLGIASNIAFISYGFLADLRPVFVLHAILLPLNVYRFVEMRRLVHDFRDEVGGSHKLDALLPYMSSVSLPSGSTLFRLGDTADDMYILTVGRIRLLELDMEIGPGDSVGEVGIFSPDGRRMATAVCSEDCKLQRITRDKLHELVHQNPGIGFYLTSVITARLLEDMKLLQRKLAEKAGAPG
jgi:CRP/FNR family cyclic AMP-dependent transcriptional regulator